MFNPLIVSVTVLYAVPVLWHALPEHVGGELQLFQGSGSLNGQNKHCSGILIPSVTPWYEHISLLALLLQHRLVTVQVRGLPDPMFCCPSLVVPDSACCGDVARQVWVMIVLCR